MFSRLYRRLSIIVMKYKQGFVFPILLFFCEKSEEGVSKDFFNKCLAWAALPAEWNSRYKRHKHKLDVWNKNSCEIDHLHGKDMGGHAKRVGSQRAMKKELAGGCCRQQSPGTALGTLLAGEVLPWLRQSCLRWCHLLWRKAFFRQQQRSKKSEVSIQMGCFPKASLKAWLRPVCRFPHFLLAWWKLLSPFLELALQKYTPFLSTHLYIASFCNATSLSEAVSRWHQLKVVLKFEVEVMGLYLSE